MSSDKIISIDALEILDSRGNPTLQVCITTDSGATGNASVPSGASTGIREAMEVRDKQVERYQGRGVQKRVVAISEMIAPHLIGRQVTDQAALDALLLTLDGTEQKSHLGANALLGVSLALAKAAAHSLHIPLYRYLGGCSACLLPCPLMNLINGGMHADNSLEFQEFMIRPIGAPSFAEAVRWGVEIYSTLKALLKEKGYSTSVGDEGGFAPPLSSPQQALELLMHAIEGAGYQLEKEITLALDCAASSFYQKQRYGSLSREEHLALLSSLCDLYPIDSIEDGMAEEDWEGWKQLSQNLGSKVQLVGDDLFVTQTQRLQRGIQEGIANAVLIKPNQVGTLSETSACIRLAQKNRYQTIASHRSGETEDTTISDIAVGFQTGQIKIGAPCRAERTCKYNRLLTIEAELGPQAKYFKETV